MLHGVPLFKENNFVRILKITFHLKKQKKNELKNTDLVINFYGENYSLIILCRLFI